MALQHLYHQTLSKLPCRGFECGVAVVLAVVVLRAVVVVTLDIEHLRPVWLLVNSLGCSLGTDCISLANNWNMRDIELTSLRLVGHSQAAFIADTPLSPKLLPAQFGAKNEPKLLNCPALPTPMKVEPAPDPGMVVGAGAAVVVVVVVVVLK